MQRTKEQNTRLHALLAQLGMDSDDKEEMVSEYTNYRTQRSSEMTHLECGQLIHSLELVQRAQDHHLDKKRKRVISHLIEAGYTKDGRADMPAIHAWVEKQKHKKHLNKHTSPELSQLIHAAAAVKNHKLEKTRS